MCAACGRVVAGLRECVCAACGKVSNRFGRSEFLLCVGEFGVGLWGEILCCVWESLVWVCVSECVLCVGEFGVVMGSECLLCVGEFGVGMVE